MRSGKTKYIEISFDKCKACWQCVEQCPKRVLGKVNLLIHKHVHIDNANNCVGCLKCANVCNRNAIQKL